MDPFEQVQAASAAQRIPTGFDADQADNLEDIEKQFAVKVVQHLETYWAILQRVRGSQLRLTKMDNEILDHLHREFPDFEPDKPIDESQMKSQTGKEKWRKFMNEYEKTIDDFNFGTIVRASPKTEYTEKGTIFVPRIQFYAIEISRNRAGLNDWIYEKAQKGENP